MTFGQRIFALILSAAAGLPAMAGAGAAPPHGEHVRSPMSALRQAKWVAEGSSHPRHVVYVFMDANCPYCRTLWHNLQPYARQGLQVRYVLVGVISASSPGKAAAIFDAAAPAAALRMNETRWNQGPVRGGGIAPRKRLSARDLSAIGRNEALMQSLDFDGTPDLVFADTDGKVYVIQGLPEKNELQLIVRTADKPSP